MHQERHRMQMKWCRWNMMTLWLPLREWRMGPHWWMMRKYEEWRKWRDSIYWMSIDLMCWSYHHINEYHNELIRIQMRGERERKREIECGEIWRTLILRRWFVVWYLPLIPLADPLILFWSDLCALYLVFSLPFFIRILSVVVWNIEYMICVVVVAGRLLWVWLKLNHSTPIWLSFCDFISMCPAICVWLVGGRIICIAFRLKSTGPYIEWISVCDNLHASFILALFVVKDFLLYSSPHPLYSKHVLDTYLDMICPLKECSSIVMVACGRYSLEGQAVNRVDVKDKN